MDIPSTIRTISVAALLFFGLSVTGGGGESLYHFPECKDGDVFNTLKCLGDADRGFFHQVDYRFTDLTTEEKLSVVCVNLLTKYHCMDLLEGCITREEMKWRKKAMLEEEFGFFTRARKYLGMTEEEFKADCPLGKMYS